MSRQRSAQGDTMGQRVKQWKCPSCGYKIENALLPVRHECKREAQAQRIYRKSKMRGLGDAVAVALAWLGITKKPGCKCKKRQEWLNKKVPFFKPNDHQRNVMMSWKAGKKR